MGEHRSTDDHDELAVRVAESEPDDALDADISLAEFLRASGREAPPVTIGEFEIERRIGRGGFGTVYAAIQRKIDRRVALKLLHAHRLGPDAAWLQREAQALARLNHPNVVQIYQVGESKYGTFIAMEHVDGGSVAVWQRGRPWREVLAAYVQAGAGLAAAHANGILHLDFKPGNVLVGADGRVRVVDFGLAGGPGVVSAASSSSVSARDDTSLPESDLPHTQATGGTSGYASPEQVTHGTVDPRSDQFSFCVAACEALFGVMPYSPAEIGLMARAPASAKPPAFGRARGPRWLRAALRRGLAPMPDMRWPTLAALLDVLGRPPWYRRNRSYAVLGALAVATPVGFANLLSTTETCGQPTGSLGAAWDEDRRNAVASAITQSGAPYSEALRETVLRDLDRYAGEWSDVSVAVCEANAVGHDTSPEDHVRHRECLRRQRDRFDQLTAMIAEGDASTVERADEMVAGLAAPASCQLLPATAGDPSRPGDPAVLELLGDVDRARLELTAGRITMARETADRAAAAAEQLGDPLARAESRLVRALVLDAMARDEEAIDELQEAAALALELGRDELAAECWRRMARISAHDLDRLEPAREWNRLDAAAVRRLGSPPHLLADQLDGEGELQRLSGDASAAETAHRTALLQLARERGPDDPRWATTWLLLAHARAAQGDADEAAALYEQALALATRRQGATHPQIANILLSRALLRRDVGAFVEADADLERAAAILIACHGTSSPVLAPVLTARAEVSKRLGRLDEAATLATEAWTLQREHLPRDHAERGGALAVLAGVELVRGHWASALELHEQLAEERRAGDEDERARIGVNLGWLLCRVGRCAEARAVLERAIVLGDTKVRAYAECGLGHVEIEAGRLPAAKHRLEVTLTLARSLDPIPPDLVAETEWLLARARFAAGDPTDTILPLVERSLAYYRGEGGTLGPADLETFPRLLASTTKRNVRSASSVPHDR